jgi:ribonuclease D
MNEASAPREPEPNLITQPGPLSALCSRLATADWIALDVEFVRDQTYYPQFCLLQVATPEFAAGVDPLALDNLDPLLDLIYRPDLTKVFHAGRQDIEILQMCRGTPPPNVFDTQIAAGFLGLPEQTGYATLIYEILGISLAKTHARTDWSRRPLSEAQLRYALDDVIYLAQAYPRLVARLESMGRLEWVHEECQGLLDPELYRSDPAQAWNRLGGIDRLSPTQLSGAQALAEWRESQAQARNLPRGWLV